MFQDLNGFRGQTEESVGACNDQSSSGTEWALKASSATSLGSYCVASFINKETHLGYPAAIVGTVTYTFKEV